MNFLNLFFGVPQDKHLHFGHMTPVGLNYNHVIDGIYVGTNQCCVMGLSEVLRNEGIEVDISLEGEKLDNPTGVIVYIWIPTPDHFPPTQDQLSFGVATLQQLVSQSKKIYLHCKNGHGRSSTLMCAYLMKTQNMTQPEAMEYIQSKRPTAHIQDPQIEALKLFAKTLKNK